MTPTCAHCDHPLGTSRIVCPGCDRAYHVECMGEIKSCSAPGCDGNLAEVLRRRSLAVDPGKDAEGFTLVQRSVALALVLGALFFSFTLVDEVSSAHGIGVVAVAVLTFAALNPDLWTYFFKDEHAA